VRDVATVLSACIGRLSAAGSSETAALLAVAHLDLTARLSGFTEAELAAVAALSAHAEG